MQTNTLTLESPATGLSSPLTVSFLDDGAPRFGFGPEVQTGEPAEIRYAADLRPLLREPETAVAGDALYAVQRYVMPANVAAEMERRGLRYVLTALRAGTVRGSAEWVRTRGHTNSVAPGTHLPYPEIHEVLHGEAWLYLQHGATDRPEDVVILPLAAGDKAVVAPGWASLLANVGTAPLVVGTWRMEDCQTETAEFQARGGMAHFILRNQSGGPVCAANPRYKAAPAPRPAEPKELPDFGLTRGEPLLAAFHHSPEYLRCLLRPQDFAEIWKSLYD